MQGRLDCRTNGAGIQHILARVVAAIDARQHQIGLMAAQHIVNPGKHAISRRAFDRIAPLGQLGVDHRMGIADAMADAGLFKGGGDCPDLALRACQLGGDLGQGHKPRGVNAVVIGDQNAHGVRL